MAVKSHFEVRGKRSSNTYDFNKDCFRDYKWCKTHPQPVVFSKQESRSTQRHIRQHAYWKEQPRIVRFNQSNYRERQRDKRASRTISRHIPHHTTQEKSTRKSDEKKKAFIL